MKNNSQIHQTHQKDTNIKNTVDIFVYGTLKVGGYFADYFDGIRKKSVQAKVKGTLFRIVYGWFPGLILGGESEVTGELHTYSNAKEVLQVMDEIEGVREKLFKREIALVKLDTGEVREAVVYTFNQSTQGSEAVESGVWDIEED